MSVFCIFDIETRVDKELLWKVFGADLLKDVDLEHHAFDPEKGKQRPATQAEAIELAYQEFLTRYRAPNGRLPMPPLPCHIPICIGYGRVNANLELVDIEVRTEENELIENFWLRYEAFDGTLVSFNGRGFDMPLLELHALRLGIPCPKHMAKGRDRYRATRHMDLLDLIRNYGGLDLTQLRGGLDMLSTFIGGPEKDMDGSEVQEYYEAGEIGMVAMYCGQDVLRTYLLFLRWEMLKGNLPGDLCRELTAAAKLKYAST